jgi:hypothetical protein
MDLLTYLAALRRWWWIVLGLPLTVLLAAVTLTPAAPYTTELQATVLIPGDTEDTGSAERPELMVLDDLPILVGSDVFAEVTLERMTADGTARAMDLQEVKDSLAGSRYSRVLTVTVTNADAADALAVAEAAAAVLPDAVNAYLVAPGTQAATVQVIDRPDDPAPAARDRWLRIGAMTFVAGFAGFAIVAAMAALYPVRADDQRAASDSK